jgi:hypothetical protein
MGYGYAPPISASQEEFLEDAHDVILILTYCVTIASFILSGLIIFVGAYWYKEVVVSINTLF